eukprot:212125-Chlamydomonas_euryale.AAC.1
MGMGVRPIVRSGPLRPAEGCTVPSCAWTCLPCLRVGCRMMGSCGICIPCSRGVSRCRRRGSGWGLWRC